MADPRHRDRVKGEEKVGGGGGWSRGLIVKELDPRRKGQKSVTKHHQNDSLSPESLLVESTDSLRDCVLRRTNSACALVPTGERTRTLHYLVVVDAWVCDV